MGAQTSNLRRSIDEEFSRLAVQGRKQLFLKQILQLRLPPSAWLLDPSHLGVLFVLDRERKGRVSLDDLHALAELAHSRLRCYQPHEFQTQMQGYCTLQMWRSIAAEGELAVCDWLMSMVSSAGRTCKFEVGGDELYLHEEGVRLLFVMFRVEETQGVQFADYLNLLQKAGEDTSLMDIEDPRQDQWVPLTIVRRLLLALVMGMSKVLSEIYPREELEQLS